MVTIEEIEAMLTDILGSDHVYYQPPESLQIRYPCIVYELNDHRIVHANNRKYHLVKEYNLTYISRSPDDEVVDKLIMLPNCKPNGVSTADNLYHYRYTIYTS